MNGGYVMLDCMGLVLTSESAQTITGLFDRVVTAYKSNKPVIAYNCAWDDDGMTPIPVMVNPNPDGQGSYICTSSTLQIIVDTDDSVTVVNMLA